MIPVAQQPEPAGFDLAVRQPGQTWLAAKGINPLLPPPKAADLPNYWTASNKDLWRLYSGVCAYFAIYFEWSTGAASTDHFIAKSRLAGEAYEWSNYRLACLGANRDKNHFDDVLDPFVLAPDTFFLNLVSGRVRPNPALTTAEKRLVGKTIKRLKLNSAENKQMRARHFSEYSRHRSAHLLKFYSPLVWSEAQRLNLL